MDAGRAAAVASSRLVAWGAVGTSVGGVLLAGAFVSIAVVGLTVAGTRVLFASTIALIFAFVGLQDALRVRRVGFDATATVLGVVACGLIGANVLPLAAIATGHVEYTVELMYTSFGPALPAGIVLLSIASVLVAIGLLRSVDLPDSGAWLLITGSVALPIILGEGATSQIVGPAGVVVLGAGFVRTGIALWRHREARRA